MMSQDGGALPSPTCSSPLPASSRPSTPLPSNTDLIATSFNTPGLKRVAASADVGSAKALKADEGVTDCETVFASQPLAVVSDLDTSAQLANAHTCRSIELSSSSLLVVEPRAVQPVLGAPTSSALITLSPSLAPSGTRDGDPRVLTEEQRAIVQFGSVVDKAIKVKDMLVVMAGAGTGKTSVLNWLVQELRHQYDKEAIAYLVFNKAAAAAAERTFNQLCLVSTLAASSLATLARARNCRSRIFQPSGSDSYQALLRRIALSTFEQEEYRDFLSSLTEVEVAWLVDKIALILGEFLDDFMQSSKTCDEYLVDRHPVLNFAEPPRAYRDLHESHFAQDHPWLRRWMPYDSTPYAGTDPRGSVHFYSSAAMSAWSAMTRPGESTSFDCITKSVALAEMWPVVSTGSTGVRRTTQTRLGVLLLDEAQDASAAQVEYLARLAAKGMLVIYVGDCVQSIYTFRGAVGLHYVRLARGTLPSGAPVAVRALSLTTCFRCASVIVAAANIVLIGKANSDQCNDFMHYTLRPTTGAPRGELLKQSLLDGRMWAEDNELIVILGRGRLGLLQKTLELLALREPPSLRLCGAQWNNEIALIRPLLKMWEAEQRQPGVASVLRLEPFAQNGAVTWAYVEQEIVEKPVKPLLFPLGVVNTYGARLAPMLSKLEQLLATAPRLDASVMLTTVHGAKGLEFDTVELLDDLCPLAAFEVVDGRGRMAWPVGNDEINLWYVALTRAKRRLVVPPKFLAFVRDMRSIGAAGAPGAGAGCPLVLGSGHSACSFPPEDVLRLRADLYVPWVAAGGDLVLSQL